MRITGVTDFVICLGYKGYMIKEYFANYVLHSSDVTIDMKDNRIRYHHEFAEPWTVTLIDTGDATLTGGRLKRVAEFLDPVEPFCLTYGDGVADIDIAALIAFHKAHGREATLSAVVPPGRYGALDLDGEVVTRFTEKPPGDNAFINGGYFRAEPLRASPHRRRWHIVGGGAARRVGARATAPRLSASRFLARHGHAARQDAPGRAMGERRCAVEGLGVSPAADSHFWQGRRVLLTGHTGFKGSWAALWLKRQARS